MGFYYSSQQETRVWKMYSQWRCAFVYILVLVWKSFVFYCYFHLKCNNKGEISSLSTNLSETASDKLQISDNYRIGSKSTLAVRACSKHQIKETINVGRHVPQHSQIHVGIMAALCVDTHSVFQGTVCTNLLLLTANRESLHAQEISLVNAFIALALVFACQELQLCSVYSSRAVQSPLSDLSSLLWHIDMIHFLFRKVISWKYDQVMMKSWELLGYIFKL